MKDGERRKKGNCEINKEGHKLGNDRRNKERRKEGK
jgi:hypothetical protein